jgi:hypothetical protein
MHHNILRRVQAQTILAWITPSLLPIKYAVEINGYVVIDTQLVGVTITNRAILVADELGSCFADIIDNIYITRNIS